MRHLPAELLLDFRGIGAAKAPEGLNCSRDEPFDVRLPVSLDRDQAGEACPFGRAFQAADQLLQLLPAVLDEAQLGQAKQGGRVAGLVRQNRPPLGLGRPCR